MARKLAFDYTFNKAARQITLNGNVNSKRLLLINNATANTVIYNVGDSALKATSTVYNAATDTTTITLNYDTTGMNNSDVLQIFTEEDGVEIKPVDTLLDPVSKFRVSEPNTLIDTDFEYGLQATKWETLERVNHIPGYYSIAGDTPLTNIADVTTNGSRIVTVITTSPHGLTTGIPIDVRGVDSVTAEGTFLVRRTTEFSFTYETRTVQPGSLAVPVSINTAYITITTGRFYVQAQVPFDNSVNVDEGPVVTDNQAVSTLSVTTPYKHGFKVGSPFYLTNTLSNRKINFTASRVPSGNVDDQVSYSLDTGTFNQYEPFHVGTSIRVINATDISTTTHLITMPNHGLVTGDPITFVGSSGTAPQINTLTGAVFGAGPGALGQWNNGTGANASFHYYVRVVDADTFRITSNPRNAIDGDALITFSATGSGLHTFSLYNSRGYELQQNITSLQTAAGFAEVKVVLNGRTNKQLGIYPERQITLSDTGIPTLDGVYVVKSKPASTGGAPFQNQNWRETDTFFIMEGPVDSSNRQNFRNQQVSNTYTLSSTASALNTLLRTKSYENTFSPTISSISGGGVITVPTLTNLGDGDLPTRVGSIVRFTNPGSLTANGAAINTASFTGTVSGNVLTLTSNVTGVLNVNQTISGGALSAGTFITAINGLTTGSTIVLSTSATIGTSTSFSVSGIVDFFISALTSTSITLSSTNPAIATTAVTIGGTQGAAAIKVLRSGVRLQMHDGSVSWQNHTRVSVHDWCSITGKMFTRECISGNRIFIRNHGLSTGTPVMFVGGGNTWTTGSNPPVESAAQSVIYFVEANNKDEITLRTTQTTGGVGPYAASVGTTAVDFLVANTWAGGVYQLHPGFTISDFTAVGTGGSGAGRDRAIGAFQNFPDYMTERAEIIVKRGDGTVLPGGLSETVNTYGVWQKYYARTIVSTAPNTGFAEFSLTLAENGSPVNFTSNATPGSGTRFMACRVTENPFSNSFYLPNHGGVAGKRTDYPGTNSTFPNIDSAYLYNGSSVGAPVTPLFDYVTDITGVNWPRVSMLLNQGSGTANTQINNLANSSRYYMVPITDDVFKVQFYDPAQPIGLLPTGQPTVQLGINVAATSQAGTATTSPGPFGTMGLRFTSTAVPNANGNRIVLPVEQQTLVEGDIVRYESLGTVDIGSAYTGAPGLVNGNLYIVRNVSDFVPITTSVSTSNAAGGLSASGVNIEHDADATVIKCDTNVSGYISAGNTIWTGSYHNERMLVLSTSADTITVQRGYAGTTAKPIPAGILLYKIHGSFQLQIKDLATPRRFSGAFSSANASTETWNISNHGLRIGETVFITEVPSGGSPSITNTITNTTITTASPAAGPFYAIIIDANNFQLAHSRAAAFAGFPLNITSTGSAGNWGFTQYYDSVPLATTASGTHSLVNVSSTGTIDGGYDAATIPSDSRMTFAPGINIAGRTITFNPKNSCDLRTGTFFYQNHGLTTGTRVVYNRNGNTALGFAAGVHPRQGYNALYDLTISSVQPNTPSAGFVTYNYNTTGLNSSPFDIVANQSVTVSGVTVGGNPANAYNGTFKVVSASLGTVVVANSFTGTANAGTGSIAGTYYAIRRNLDMFQLAYTKQDALNGNAIQNYSILGGDGGHQLTTLQVTGESLGNGLATIVARDLIVNGSLISVVLAASDRINFNGHGFNTGDRVVYQVWGNGRNINGLVSGRQYFINNTAGTQARGGATTGNSANQFSLHNTWVGAYTNTDLVDILGVGTSTLHQFKVTNPTLKGTTFKGDWNSTDIYSYGDVVLFRNNYYMSVIGAIAPGQTTFVGNQNNQPVADTDGRANIQWMLLPPLPSYSTRFLAQYRGGDSVKLSGKMPIKTLIFNGALGANGLTSTASGVFNIASHGLSTGDAVTYKLDAQGAYHNGTDGNYSEYVSNLPQLPIGGLLANQTYYVNVIDNDNFTLHNNPPGAFVGGQEAAVTYTGAGTGTAHRFEKYEGFVFDMQVLAVNNDSDMIVTDPYPTRQIVFNPQSTLVSVSGLATPVVSVEREEIYIPNHGLNTGVKVYYSNGFGIGNAIGGLTDGQTYYVIKINDDVIRLASSLSNALTFQRIDLSSTGAGFNHYLVAATYCSSSYIRYRGPSAGTATDRGALTTDSLTGGNAHLYASQTSANIRDGVLQAIPFIYETQMFVRPDCLNLHRSFDGGVEISAAKAPGVNIVRQTRRYFRYQSGKGLQYSTGINFSPSIDVSSVTHDGVAYATVTCRKPHKLSASNKIIMEDVVVASGTNAPYVTPANGQFFTVYDILDEFRFRYATNGIPSDLAPAGFPALFLYEWSDARVRAGMYDDANGMFFEYDGQQLYCVRRNSTAQMAGSVSVAFKSNAVVGTNTRFTKQLVVGDYVLIRGMSYKVTAVDSDTSIHISPSYRGTTRSRIVMCKVRDLKVPQSQWNIDKCDGNGVTGFKLDIHRQQMAYMDYSWYGAGKVRFGFKDQKGIVTYVHEFVHNNHENEAYLRSGNLPARYEVINGDTPTYAPSLYHWGASVIMDGKFEDDKAYLFTVASGSVGSDTVNVSGALSGTAVPILSIRLAPSVDSSLVGPLGERDLVNRMILKMNSCGIVCTPEVADQTTFALNTTATANRKDATSIRLVLNGNLSQSAYFTNYGAPSLCQIIKHTGQVTDTLTGGVVIFEFRAAAGTPASQELGELVEMGNSILGGDYVYPNGPDVLTLAVVTTIPFLNTALAGAGANDRGRTAVTARISWTESQA